MIIWGALFIPIIVTILFWYFFREKFIWWELLIPIGVALVLISIAKISIDYANTTFTEYWGSTITKVEYYEEWNEYIHQTCTRSYTDSQGNTHTETYDCSYVQYHSAYWEAETTSGETVSISQKRYNLILQEWKATPIFKDLFRNYHSIDGDMYYANWNRQERTAVPVTTKHTYVNKVKASDLTIFNIKVVKEKDADSLKLFKYPELHDEFTYPTILGIHPHDTIVKKFKNLNGKFGPLNEVRIWVLVFKNTAKKSGLQQENYWVRGNMNELVICIGVNNDYDITWSHVFSWTTNELIKPHISNYISSMRYVDNSSLDRLSKYLNKEIPSFKRRSFNKEFDYITVDPSTKAVILVYLLVLFVSIGINLWNIMNDIDKDDWTNY